MSESDGDDPLSREVIIAAKLEEHGVAVRAKSRTVAALDRLVGSLFDLPTPFFEGVSRKKRLKDEIEERLMRAEADIAERKLAGMADAGDALLGDLLKDKARRQINSASVAVQTVDALKQLPPPEDESASEDEPSEIDEDWMNQFVRFAEDASSDELRQLWGRVLAGEIRKSGSFSRHTLRFIAELDKETASNCEFAARRAIGDLIPRSDEWNSGQGYLIGLDLQRLGLIEGVGGIGGPERNMTLDESGVAGITGRQRALLIEGKPGTKVSWNVMILTRMGKEVFSLLDASHEGDALRSLAETLPKEGLSKMSIGLFADIGGGRKRIFNNEVVWQAEAPDAASEAG